MNSSAPPPIQVPAQFGQDKTMAAFFSALINTIYQLWTTVYNLRFTPKVETTGATVAGLFQITIPTNKTILIDAAIAARRTSGSAGAVGDSAWYRLYGGYKNIAGVVTAIGTPTLFGGEDQAGWNVGFSVAGSTVTITVLGAVNNTVTWEGSISVVTVGI